MCNFKETEIHYSAITNFWFKEIDPDKWFVKDKSFDSNLSNKFSSQVQLALDNKLENWKENEEGYLALILLLDQFTRNIFRNDPKAFSGDTEALNLCFQSILKGMLNNNNSSWRHFFLMPMMHSENIAIQEMSLPLFEKYTNEKTLNYARKHHKIIQRFGRFPHRNKILDRKSSDYEFMFLKEPGSSF